MHVELSLRALNDLRSVRSYLVARSPAGAEAVRRALDSTIERLSQFPRLGRRIDELNVRAIGVPRFAYTIYYDIEPHRIVILHIRDQRRHPLTTADL